MAESEISAGNRILQELARARARRSANPEDAEAARAELMAESALERSPGCFAEALDLLGARALPRGADPFGRGRPYMDLDAAAGDPRGAEGCLERLARLFPERAREPSAARDLWVLAIGFDLDGAARALAGIGCVPDPGGRAGEWAIACDERMLGRFSLARWGARIAQADLPSQARIAPQRSPESADFWEPSAGAVEAMRARPRIWPSALAFAAWSGSERVLGMLLSSGSLASITGGEEDSRALLSACRLPDRLSQLKEAGFPLEGPRDARGANPLHRAAAAGRVGHLERLLDLCGAWALQPTEDGELPADLCEDPMGRSKLEAAAAGAILPEGGPGRRRRL